MTSLPWLPTGLEGPCQPTWPTSWFWAPEAAVCGREAWEGIRVPDFEEGENTFCRDPPLSLGPLLCVLPGTQGHRLNLRQWAWRKKPVRYGRRGRKAGRGRVLGGTGERPPPARCRLSTSDTVSKNKTNTQNIHELHSNHLEPKTFQVIKHIKSMVSKSRSNAKRRVRIYYTYNARFLLSERDTARKRQNSHAACSKKWKND